MIEVLTPILFVEDDPSDARLVLNALGRLDLANCVTLVADGVDALDYLYSRGNFSLRSPGNPRVVLLDLKLPRLSGLEVLKHIRSDAALKLVPVVVLSSSRQESDVRSAYDSGANGYIVKAIDYKSSYDSLTAFGEFWTRVNQPPPDGSQSLQ